MLLFAVAIVSKAVYIQLVEGPELRLYAKKQFTKEEVLAPERGNIYTEDGRLLSSSIPEFTLRIDFQSIQKDTFYKYLPSLSKSLSTILGRESAGHYKLALTKQFQKKKKPRYYRLARNVGYSEYLKIKELEPFCKGPYKGGFIAEATTKRKNPFGQLASRTVGIWRPNAPNVGLEDAYDEFLKGKDGQRIIRKIAGGAWMPIDGSEIDPENGKDIITTLDMNIQDVAENALRSQLQEDQAAFGTCIVMEVKTGKIKAISNLGRNSNGAYSENKNYALYPIEPGSTSKLISMVSLMNDDKTQIDDRINCLGGKIKFGKHTIRDSHLGTGTISIKDAFSHSSNVAFSKLIYYKYRGEEKKYYDNLKGLGLNKPTGLGIKGEMKTRLNEDLYKQDKFIMASQGMGYGLMLSPMHMCMVYNTVANNGKLMKPYVVNSIQDYGRSLKKFEPVVLNENAVNEDAIEPLKEVLHAVVEEGTGKKLRNPYYDICGKTGTAQVVDKGIKRSDKVYHASFIGFFPKEDPQYTICVVIRTSKGSKKYYGGQLALPVFQEVADRLYGTHIKNEKSYVKTDSNRNQPIIKNIHAEQYNVLARVLDMPQKELNFSSWVKDVDQNKMTKSINRMKDGQVPDVKGMGLKNAIYVLENAGLRVVPIGRGKVRRQSLIKGASYKKGNSITIHLS